jgi:hypothetical protein
LPQIFSGTTEHGQYLGQHCIGSPELIADRQAVAESQDAIVPAIALVEKRTPIESRQS